MVFRWVIRYLANNEQLINRIADSYPIRRAAQLVVYLFNVGKLAASGTRPAGSLDRFKLRSFMERLQAELKDGKEEIKAKAEELKRQQKNMKGSQEPSAVVYLGRHSLEKPHTVTTKDWLKSHMCVPPKELLTRIMCSLFPSSYLSPPDLLGPSLAILILAALLHMGHSAKASHAASSAPSPILALLLYVAFIPAVTYVSVRLAGATLTLMETVSLMGYATYGHLFAMGIPVLFQQAESEIFFFWCLTIFGGLTSLRLVFVLIVSVRVPAARLVVCSLVATIHLLSLIFLHFVYMHRTFVYGGKQ